MNIDWSKAPEGATHFDPVDQNWLRQFNEVALGWLEAKGWSTKGWQYPNELSIMPRLIARPVWTGEGLPPAGAECEFSDWKKEDWKRGVVRYISAVTAVIEIGDNHEQIAHPTTLRYRPIRTPEQIAAEEREKGILQLAADAGHWWKDCPFDQLPPIMAVIYDAGYRKAIDIGTE